LGPWGAYVWSYPMGQWYLIWPTINMLQFQYVFCYDYSILWGQIDTLFVKKCIFCIKRHIWHPGVSMYGLNPWSHGIFFDQIKLEHFYQNMHILPKTSRLPPGVLMYGLNPWRDVIFFKELLICFNFSMSFVMIF